MSQLSGPEQGELVSLLAEHTDSIDRLDNAMHHAGLERAANFSTGPSKPAVISAIVRAFSDQYKVVELVEAVLHDKYGLKGNCPPIENWLVQNREARERKSDAGNASAGTTLSNTAFTTSDESCARFRIMHLSDFHFSFGETQTTLRHSLPHLRGIEQILEETNPDLLIVTGDMSAHGDKNSLERAKNWLIGKETFDGESYGLNLSGRLPKIPFVVVSGNADFTAKPIGGDAESRINASLRYFRQLFSDTEVSPGVSYLRAGLKYAFFFKLTIPPSSGERSSESSTTGYSDSEVRDIYRREWKRIAAFHADACRNGVRENGSQLATPQQYTQSPKILITHQPLLEGTASTLESEVKDFLLSLASIGIHVILCGHQHVHLLEQQPLSKLKRKKNPLRSIYRYLLDSLGINDPPQWFGGDGKRLPSRLRPFFASLVEQAKSWIVNNPSTELSDEAVVLKCEELLHELLDSQGDQLPSKLVNQLKSQLLEAHKDLDTVNEARCIEELLRGLTQPEILKLREASKSKPVSQFYREFYKKNVIQCRCGSSGKINGPANRQRNLQIYDIKVCPEHWSIHCKVYPWSSSKFSPDGIPWVAHVKR